MPGTFDELTPAALDRAPTLSSQVTAALEEMIVESEFEPGHRLPSERVLAEKFDVSRTVIRESVQALVAKGLLDVRRGSGTVVCRPAAATVARSVSLLLRAGRLPQTYEQIHEVRLMFEIEIARLAAERHGPEDLDRLERLVERLEVESADRDQRAAADVAFHSALASASGNQLLVVLHDSIADVMLEVRRRAFDIEGGVQRASGHHRKILLALRARDGDRAAEAMREHLYDSHHLMFELGDGAGAPAGGGDEGMAARPDAG